MVKLFHKKIFLGTLILLGFLVFSEKVQAGYADFQGSNTVDISASKIEADVPASNLINSTFVPSDNETAVATIENVASSEDFNYRVKVNVSGDIVLCDELQLEARQDKGVGMISVYTGSLSSFVHDDGGLDYTFLASGNNHDWEFEVYLSEDVNNSVENKTCNFDFVASAWDDGLINPTSGWLDEEILNSNTINSGDWVDISNISSSNPVPTPGVANSVNVDISWDTDIVATSQVAYSTDSSDDLINDYDAMTVVDSALVLNHVHNLNLSPSSFPITYYYRVISEDSLGVKSYSDINNFTLTSNTTSSAFTDIVLNEFVPSPSGLDDALMPNGEWVEIYNKGAVDVDLVGWEIGDNTASRAVIAVTNSDNDGDGDITGETVVPAGGYLVVYLQGDVYLQNEDAADKVVLYDNGGVVIDEVDYDPTVDFASGEVPDDKTYARFPDGIGPWVDPEPTPGRVNEFTSEEKEYFQEIVLNDCFEDNKLIENEKQSLCSPVFVDYIGLIDDVNSDELKDEFINDEVEIVKDLLEKSLTIEEFFDEEKIKKDNLNEDFSGDNDIEEKAVDDAGDNEDSEDENVDNSSFVEDKFEEESELVDESDLVNEKITDEDENAEVKDIVNIFEEFLENNNKYGFEEVFIDEIDNKELSE